MLPESSATTEPKVDADSADTTLLAQRTPGLSFESEPASVPESASDLAVEELDCLLCPVVGVALWCSPHAPSSEVAPAIPRTWCARRSLFVVSIVSSPLRR